MAKIKKLKDPIEDVLDANDVVESSTRGLPPASSGVMNKSKDLKLKTYLEKLRERKGLKKRNKTNL